MERLFTTVHISYWLFKNFERISDKKPTSVKKQPISTYWVTLKIDAYI